MIRSALLPFALVLMASAASAQQSPVPAVVAAEARIMVLGQTATFNGRLDAERHVSIIARVGGTLQEIAFAPGDRVEQGQRLFVIDPALYQTTVAEAEAGLRSAEAARDLARLDRDRQDELVKRETAPRAVLDVAEATLASREADVMRLTAVLEREQLNLSYTEITAPFAGVMGIARVSVGALIGPEAGQLATLTMLDPIYAEFAVPTSAWRSYSDSLAAGTASKVNAVTLRLANGRDHDAGGDIVFVDSAVNAGTDSVTIRARFDNPEGALLDDELVRVTLRASGGAGELAIPLQAVQRDIQGAFVLVVGAGEVVEQRRVTVSRSTEGMSVIADGLAEGERVITEGVNKVRPGIAVDAALAGDD